MDYSKYINEIIPLILQNNLINDYNPTIQILNYDLLQSKINQLNNAFKSKGNENFLFCFAIKSNPLTNVLKFFNQNNYGAECASYGEVF